MKTEKTYIQCMKELSPDVVYRGLLRKGLFAEKLPPIFTSEQFFDYYKRNKIIRQQTPKKCQYVTYENMGHHNVPCTLAIPSPSGYTVCVN